MSQRPDSACFVDCKQIENERSIPESELRIIEMRLREGSLIYSCWAAVPINYLEKLNFQDQMRAWRRNNASGSF